MHYGGWREDPQRTSPDVIPLPLPPPVRQRPGCGTWYWYGVVLCVLSLASLALGVADVVLTYRTYMEDKKCKDSTTPDYCLPANLVYTWVAVGIWASLPVFMFGIYCIYKGNPSSQQCGCYQLLAFSSVLIFTPAMVVISAIEVYKGRNVYYWKAQSLPEDDLVKAILPIVIASLGFIQHVVSLFALSCMCCCTVHAPSRLVQPSNHVYGTSLVDMGRTTVINCTQPTNRIQQLSPNQLPYNNVCRPTANLGCRTSCGAGPTYPSSFFTTTPTRTSVNNQWMGMNQYPAVSANPAYNFFRT